MSGPAADASIDVAAAAARVAGQHARETQRRYAARAAAAVGVSFVALFIGIVVLGFHWTLLAVEAGVIGAVLAIDSKASPLIERWRRGAEGEERVGRVVDRMRESGWLALHDVQLGRGNVDHIVIGPAGIYTIETKSTKGRLKVKNIDPGMLQQAYAEAKLVERITGLRTEPLLVFSNAYLVPAVSRRDGVAVLPARMLAGYLKARGGNIPAARVSEVYARLASALSV